MFFVVCVRAAFTVYGVGFSWGDGVRVAGSWVF